MRLDFVKMWRWVVTSELQSSDLNDLGLTGNEELDLDCDDYLHAGGQRSSYLNLADFRDEARSQH